MAIRFDDRVVIVTGSGNGLGRSHALEFARRGARVVVNDLGAARDGSGASSDAANAVVKQIVDEGGEAMASGANVADYGQVEAMVAQAVDRWGRVDVLVNNAGILRDKSFHKMDDADWELRAVITGEVVRTVRAREMFRQLCAASWECADPGMQFDTTINRWHTAANTDRINGSNPCSEYMHIDNSACNLASLNLLKFNPEGGVFDVDGFKAAVEVVFTAQEILVGRADYPTEAIAENSRKFRQLGIGYANLGALLMALGHGYDTDSGRAWAAALTSLMTGHAYATSARTAARMGPFAGYAENRDPMLGVLNMHREANAQIDEELVPAELLSAAQQAWDDACEVADVHGTDPHWVAALVHELRGGRT